MAGEKPEASKWTGKTRMQVERAKSGIATHGEWKQLERLDIAVRIDAGWRIKLWASESFARWMRKSFPNQTAGDAHGR